MNATIYPYLRVLLPVRERDLHIVSTGDARRNRQKRRRVLAQRRLLRSGLLPNRALPLSWAQLPQEYIDGLKASYPGRSYYGPPEYECAHCSAVFWFHERSKRHSSARGQRFVYNNCCRGDEEGLTGNAACRWYVCPNVSEATALKNSLHANFEPISRIVLRDQIPQATILTGPAEEKTIQEILEINPYDFPPTGLRCTVTIAKLSPSQSWWFFSCNKCSRKSVPDGTSYKCSSCLCRTAKPRYKLCVIGTDGTANAEFMLFGDIGQQVVGKQVGAVLRSNSGTDTIPPDIAQIVTKKYTWHVSITEKSFQGPKKSYQVSRIIVALGRQSAIPRITCSPNPISSPLQIVTSDVTPNCPLETTPPPQQMCSNKPEKQQSNKEPYATLSSTRKRLFDAQSASTQHTEPDSCSKKKLLVVDETDRLGFVQTKLQSVPEQQITKDISTCTDVAQKNSGSEINK